MKKNNIVVTGAAGFIGYHICKNLLKADFNVIGLDNLNSYYDISLKQARLNDLSKTKIEKEKFWRFLQLDICNKDALLDIFEEFSPRIVINFAAQAGVRYSIDNPDVYINSNIVGFSNILECCRQYEIENLLYASSSSVYGGNTKTPFSENDSVNQPVSLYAATKRSNELMAHSYSHLYNIPSTGMRLFTVYGPWGRPDMAPMKFTKAILEKKPIEIFNYGNMSRSFTYIDDVVEIILKLLKKPASSSKEFKKKNSIPSISRAPHRIFNIGNSNSIQLNDFIVCLENELGIKAVKEYLSMQQGDVEKTESDNYLLEKWIGELPNTNLEIGIKKFINWYLNYYF